MSEHRTRYNLKDFFIILDGNFEIPDRGVFRISKALIWTPKKQGWTNEIFSNQGEEEEEKLSLRDIHIGDFNSD